MNNDNEQLKKLGISNHKLNIWTEDIKILFINPIFIPTEDMTIEEQINCITRLIFCVFIILIIFMTSSINSFIFLLISLVIIIFIYNYYKRMYTKEKFSFESSGINPKTSKNLKNKYAKPIYDTKKRVFCDNYNKLDAGPNFISKNKQLTGPPHPRTFTNPVIVNPLYDLDAWRDNNNIVFSQINKQTNEDLYYSGVEPATCCGNLGNSFLVPDSVESNIYVNNKNRHVNNNNNYEIKNRYVNDNNNNYEIKNRHVNDDNNNYEIKNRYINDKYLNNNDNLFQNEINNNFIDKTFIDSMFRDTSDTKTEIKEEYIDYPGAVNRQCGYNPKQVYQSNLPSNYPASNCEQTPNVSNYNKNLFTQIVQPGMYYNSDVIEPINSNIGISFNQQFEPTTCQFTDDGGVLYKAHDPSMVQVVRPNDRDDIINEISNDNIYDPRSNGYGTSYRAYNHDITGQTRFMYDDIDAIRMPNYITRSNIDFERYADSYGTLKSGEENGNIHNSNIRALAQDSWLRNSLQFRNDLTMMRSRKQLAEAWQRRVAPIHTMNTKAIASKRVF